MSQFQFLQSTTQDGSFVKENNLAAAMLTRPEVLPGVIKAYGGVLAQDGGQPYSALTHFVTEKGGSKYKIVGSDEVQWDVMGRRGKAIPIVSLVSPATAALPGIGKSEFVLALAEKYFHRNWTVRFSNGQTARVHKDPLQVGNLWHYTFVLCGNDMNAFLASSAYEPGQQIGWVASNEGEGSIEGGSNIHTPMKFRNGLTTRRLAHRMTGTVKNTYITLKDTESGEILWTTFRQWQYYQDWMMMTERGIWLDEYNFMGDGTYTDFDSKTGFPIKTGAGMEQQLTSVNRQVVSALDPDMFWHMLNNIADSSDSDDGVHITMYTGHGGVYEFDQALRKSAARLNLIDTHFVRGTEGKGHPLEFGAQYKTYEGPWGGTITVVRHKAFDDPTVFTGRLGKFGYTDQSYKMFFINHGTKAGVPNVQFVARGQGGDSRQLIHWGTEGATTWAAQGIGTLSDKTFNNMTGVIRSHDRDSAEMYTLSETGVILNNPLCAGMIQIIPPTY